MKNLFAFVGAVMLLGALVVALVVTPIAGDNQSATCGTPIDGQWGTGNCTQQLLPVTGLAGMMFVVGSVVMAVGFREE